MKAVTGGIAAAILVLVQWLLGHFFPTLPVDVSAAIITVISFVVGLFTKSPGTTPPNP